MSHSRLAPSSSKSWCNCTASVQFIRVNKDRLPPDRGSVYADEGTQAHTYAEQILNGTLADADLPDQFAPVLEYTSRCKELANRWGGTILIEEKVPLFYLPEETGTVDFGLLCDNGLFIRDLKYGAGVEVHAEENEQLAIYAQSLVEDLALMYDINDNLPVSIGIVQPRYVGEDIEKLWTISVKDLREFTLKARESAALILLNESDPVSFVRSGGKLVYAPSIEACRWCKGKALCKFRIDTALEAFTTDARIIDQFEDLDAEAPLVLPSIEALTDKQIASALRHKETVTKFFEDAVELAQSRALNGKPVEGTKLVSGREGNKTWKDEDAAARGIDTMIPDDELYVRKIISPTKALVLIKKKVDKAQLAAFKAEHVFRSPGKPIVALAEDPRLAISAPLDAFNIIPDDNEETP